MVLKNLKEYLGVYILHCGIKNGLCGYNKKELLELEININNFYLR